jgi:hypothetical protein
MTARSPELALRKMFVSIVMAGLDPAIHVFLA